MSRHVVCRKRSCMLANNRSTEGTRRPRKNAFRVVKKHIEHVECNFIYFSGLGPVCAQHSTPHTLHFAMKTAHSSTWTREGNWKIVVCNWTTIARRFFRLGHEANSFQVPNTFLCILFRLKYVAVLLIWTCRWYRNHLTQKRKPRCQNLFASFPIWYYYPCFGILSMHCLGLRRNHWRRE